MITTEILFNYFFHFFAIYYITHILLVDDNGGPFESATKKVLIRYTSSNGLNVYSYSVGLWDWIRRFLGAYEVDGDQWTFKRSYINLFICSKCLSFWVSFFYFLIIVWITILRAPYETELYWFLFIVPTSGLITYLDNR